MCIQLHENILDPDHVPEEAICDQETHVSVGKVLGMSVAAGRNDGDSCGCVLEVYGSEGYACFGVHDHVLKDKSFWGRCTEAVAMACTLPDGNLRDAIAPAGFISPAYITVSVAGVVRVSSAMSFHTLVSSQKWRDGGTDLVDICQMPVALITDPSASFCVIMGCFRAGVVVFVDADGKVATKRFLLKGKRRLSMFSVFVVHEEPFVVRFQERESGCVTEVRYEKDGGVVHVDLDCENMSVGISEGLQENHEVAFRSLLRGIEKLGELECVHELKSRRTEELLASYNAALLFVLEWKRGAEEQSARRLLKNSCVVRIESTPVPDSPRFDVPIPVVGKECFLTIFFTNNVGTAMGEGWMLRARVSKWRPEADVKYETEKWKALKARQESDRESVVRELNAPLGLVSPGQCKSISFPLVLESHSPISVSIALRFQHPCAKMAAKQTIDIELCLQKERAFDILDFSGQSMGRDQDSSHENIAPSQLMLMFDRETVDKRRGHALITRFELPFHAETVRKVLRMTEHTSSLRSVLGAAYVVTVADVLRLEKSASARPDACTVTIRGHQHVTPFVRAAIIRRLLQSDVKPSSIIIQGSGNIEKWQRSVTDTSDECLPQFRRAEENLVEALRLFSEMEETRSIDLYYDRGESKVLLDAMQEAFSSYAEWRRQTEHIWTPFGAVSQ